MTKVLKYLGMFSILLFGFYYTEVMSDVVINNSSLMSQINEVKNEYNIEPVNAIINDNYIIPGLNGKIVNVLKSYNNMRGIDLFNSYYLVYDEISPEISLINNKDKIITSGNSNKQSVSIVISNNEKILSYSLSKNIHLTRLVNYDTYLNSATYEQINNDFINYENLEKQLNKYNQNKKICIIMNNKNLCKNKNSLLVYISVILNQNNIANIKNNISSGYVIFIDDNVSLEDYKLLLRQIYYQDLKIVYLSDLISENRD